LYNKDKTVLIKYPEGKKGDFVIPNSVTKIEWDSFRNSKNLTSVTIPNSITEISGDNFDDCVNLTSVKFEGTILKKNFHSYAFFSDLRIKFYATDAINGTPGTYTTTAPVNDKSVWTRRP